MFLQANYLAHYFKPLIWLIGFVVTSSLCTFLCVIEPYCCPKQKKHTNEPQRCTGWHVSSLPCTHAVYFILSQCRTNTHTCCLVARYSPLARWMCLTQTEPHTKESHPCHSWYTVHDFFFFLAHFCFRGSHTHACTLASLKLSAKKCKLSFMLKSSLAALLLKTLECCLKYGFI